jgi:hypothetical protein
MHPAFNTAGRWLAATKNQRQNVFFEKLACGAGVFESGAVQISIEFTDIFSLNCATAFMPETCFAIPKDKGGAVRNLRQGGMPGHGHRVNLNPAMNGEKAIAQAIPKRR